jgi:hypothetical protein
MPKENYSYLERMLEDICSTFPQFTPIHRSPNEVFSIRIFATFLKILLALFENIAFTVSRKQDGELIYVFDVRVTVHRGYYVR